MEASFKWDASADGAVADVAVGADGKARILVADAAGHARIWTVAADGSRSAGTRWSSRDSRPAGSLRRPTEGSAFCGRIGTDEDPCRSSPPAAPWNRRTTFPRCRSAHERLRSRLAEGGGGRPPTRSRRS
jgi:hypothetical protein